MCLTDSWREKGKIANYTEKLLLLFHTKVIDNVASTCCTANKIQQEKKTNNKKKYRRHSAQKMWRLLIANIEGRKNGNV